MAVKAVGLGVVVSILGVGRRRGRGGRVVAFITI